MYIYIMCRLRFKVRIISVIIINGYLLSKVQNENTRVRIKH